MVQTFNNFSKVGQPENQISKSLLPIDEIQHNLIEFLV